MFEKPDDTAWVPEGETGKGFTTPSNPNVVLRKPRK